MAVITWDTVNKGAGVTLSNGNLTASGVNNLNSVRASAGKTSGKFYWEVKVDVVSAVIIGIVNSTTPLNTNIISNANSRLYYSTDGKVYVGGIAYGATYTTGDVIGVLLDLDNGTIEFRKNGTSLGVAFNDIKTLGEVFPAIASGNTSAGNTTTVNFGATEFKYSIPNGYKSYEIQNVNKILLSSGNGKVKKISSLIVNTENAIPKMTSDILPSGVASASGSVGSTALPWKAFDRNLSSSAWQSPIEVNNWISYEFPVSIIIGKYGINSGNGSPITLPKLWTFEGSNDGFVKDINVLDSQNNQTEWTSNQLREFTIKNTKKYKSYRVNISANNGGTNVYISEIEMYEVKSIPLITSLSIQSEKNFFNHGMSQSDLASVDMYSDFTEKHYIQDATTTLGSGKVFEHTLDVNKVLKKIVIK